ncbi:MAG: PSD1 and planctomycete cytochrome C domain-containing protein [Planctomycetota bacterium]
MPRPFSYQRALSVSVVLAAASSLPAAAAGEIRFGRDILPLLAENCFACHGPDEGHREADLRLDTREGLLAAVDLAKPAASELITRVTATDPEMQMPPPAAHKKPLRAEQVRLLTAWIAAGVPWGSHWAFEPPVRPKVPDVGEPHPVDAFVAAGLARAGLAFAPEAPSHVLARRAAFDLTGLPADAADVAALEAAAAAGEFDTVWTGFVRKLLASPHYGERMAIWWLDAARYADTDGFQRDETRTNWPWRDWVVEAFNTNLPFDRFTVEQTAGDLLPGATASQKIATGFHRNHMTNGEGGRDPEESRIDYVIDRVNTTGTTWLGLTLGCCQCHSHKYDPVSQHEYYSLAAFFDSIDESGAAGRAAKPYLAVESPHVARAVAEAEALVAARKPAHDAARQAAENPFAAWLAAEHARVRQSPGFTGWQPLAVASVTSSEGTQFTVEPDGTVQAQGPEPFQDDYFAVLPGTGIRGGVARANRAALPAERGHDGESEASIGRAEDRMPMASVRRDGKDNPAPFEGDDSLAVAAPLARITGLKLEVFRHPSHTRGGFGRGPEGHFVVTDIKLRVAEEGSAQVRELQFAKAVADHSDDPKKHQGYGAIKDVLDDDPRNGWSTRDQPDAERHVAVFALAEPLVLAPHERLVFEIRQRSTLGGANLGRFRLSATASAGPAIRSLDEPPLEGLSRIETLGDKHEHLPGPLRSRLLDEFLADHEPYRLAKRALDVANRQLAEAKAARKVDVMVLAERQQPRTTHLLVRGVWDAKGDVVTPGAPAALGGMSVMLPGRPATRLDLANWLVAPTNPLTARVAVNHLWQIAFGAGLVRSSEDFGLQGERPAHPELLDWLAIEFREGSWDVKRLLELLLTSRTYRQASAVSADLDARDPANRLLARGPRYRLPSWMLRDQALAAAGLLNPALGGPPVRPWHPPGVWEELFMGRFTYEPSAGPAQHRRTLYAFWRRSIAPTFLFDSAQRRTCEVNLPRTNTPLQALTLLNDLVYLEAARGLAERTIAARHSAGQAEPEHTVTAMFHRVLFRQPAPAELAVLVREFGRARGRFAADEAATAAYLTATDPGGIFGAPPSTTTGGHAAPAADRAAATLVASLILNLDEALTHE